MQMKWFIGFSSLSAASVKHDQRNYRNECENAQDNACYSSRTYTPFTSIIDYIYWHR